MYDGPIQQDTEPLPQLLHAVIGPAPDGPAALARRLTVLEQLKSLVAAAQARTVNALLRGELAAAADANRRDTDAYCSVAGQVALARHESQHRGRVLLGVAHTLCTEMPATLAALDAGQTNERRAELIVRATSFLTAEQRRELDAELAPRLGGMGDRDTDASAHAIAYRLDPAGFTDHCRQAAKDRRVTLRPAPDTMAYLTALLPVSAAVACYAALKTCADTAVSMGDAGRSAQVSKPRRRDQVMADELLIRLTGGALTGIDERGLPIHAASGVDGPARPATAAPVIDPVAAVQAAARRQAGDDTSTPPAQRDVPKPAPTTPAPVIPEPASRRENRAPGTSPAGQDLLAPTAEPEPAAPPTPPATVVTEIELIITDKTLYGDDPAHLIGYGPLPAPLARDLALADHSTKAFFRRLYHHPDTGQLLAMDSRQRLFPPGIKKFLRLRDHHCRTPWCGAPLRHTDHLTPASHGGPTTAGNGQGLCAQCNYLVALHGWTTVANSNGTITTTPPTGTAYDSPPRAAIPIARSGETVSSSRSGAHPRSERRPSRRPVGGGRSGND